MFQGVIKSSREEGGGGIGIKKKQRTDNILPFLIMYIFSVVEMPETSTFCLYDPFSQDDFYHLFFF